MVELTALGLQPLVKAATLKTVPVSPRFCFNLNFLHENNHAKAKYEKCSKINNFVKRLSMKINAPVKINDVNA